MQPATMMATHRAETLSHKDITAHLRKVTGCSYSFTTATNRKLGPNPPVETSKDEGFWQWMPDGIDHGFFDWYCTERICNQFLTTKEMAALFFTMYYFKWKEANI